MRTPAAFRQSDVTRALKAAKAAGVDVARVEIDPSGRIIVVAGKPLDQAPEAQDDLDRELEEWRGNRGF